MSKMFHPCPSGRLSAGFDDVRPLGHKPGDKTHPHGAEDYAASMGDPIYAVEDGELYGYMATRSELGKMWDSGYIAGHPFPWRNYFYDTYGGILVLKGASGMVHVYAHLYMNRMFNFMPLMGTRWGYFEEKKDARFPMMAMHTLSNPVYVTAGSAIGVVGNAGFSTGPHLHFETHHGWGWDEYRDRVVPSSLFQEEKE